MGEHRIFVETTKESKVDYSENTTYSYDPRKEEFVLYWKGKKLQTLKGVYEGEPLWIMCSGETSFARRLRLPTKRTSCLMWLLGFDKDTRAYSQEEYDLLFEQKYDGYDCQDSQTFVAEGHGWALALRKKKEKWSGVEYVAAYISKKAADNKRAIKEMFRKWQSVYPEVFVSRILRERFYFTDEDLAEIA